MEKRNLVGKKVKGFKYDDYKGCYYVDVMDKFIGVEGVVDFYDEDIDAVRIDFGDGEKWYYPAQQAIDIHNDPDLKLEIEVVKKDLESLQGTVKHYSDVIKEKDFFLKQQDDMINELQDRLSGQMRNNDMLMRWNKLLSSDNSAYHSLRKNWIVKLFKLK